MELWLHLRYGTDSCVFRPLNPNIFEVLLVSQSGKFYQITAVKFENPNTEFGHLVKKAA